VQQRRNPQPSAGIIDSQSVKGADTVGRDNRAGMLRCPRHRRANGDAEDVDSHAHRSDLCRPSISVCTRELA
jgi:hypothetical protein